jgi:Nucleotidyltransferase of unknown function (DUF6036)
MSVGLGREDIRALLDDLSAELGARGARAELFLVGGAALAVAYDATRATRDLDAVFIPADVVRQAATAVAEHRGLTEDWLNDAVKGFLPGPDPDAQRFYSSDSLIVDVASPRYLLAMKLFAARAEIDADDIILLYHQLGFTTVDEGPAGDDELVRATLRCADGHLAVVDPDHRFRSGLHEGDIIQAMAALYLPAARYPGADTAVAACLPRSQRYVRMQPYSTVQTIMTQVVRAS